MTLTKRLVGPTGVPTPAHLEIEMAVSDCNAWSRASRRAGAIVVAAVLGTFGAHAGAQTKPQGAPGVRAAPGAVPAAIVGRWGFAAASSNYCDPLGRCAPGSGGTASFAVASDGSAEFQLFESSLVPGCGEIRVLTRMVGTVAVSGTTLVFSPRAGTYTSQNGCRPDLTGTWALDAASLAPSRLGWQIVSRDALRLVDPNDRMSGVYSRR